MGLLRAVGDAIGGVLADQWRDYFYCDSLSNEVLAVKGRKRTDRGRGSNKGGDNIISDGSVIAVNEGQCMVIVEQGQVTEFCADPGEFVYDGSSEPSLFSGSLPDTVADTFRAIGRRVSFGGSSGRDQRVYYFNIKEIMGNLFGTPVPVPFRVVDANIGLDVDISIRCNGEYSFRICDPLLFYRNVCGNFADEFESSRITGQLKSELVSALQPAFADISAMGVRYSAVPAHTAELTEFLNRQLGGKWRELRGIEIVSMTIRGMNASEEDEKMIKELQRTAVFVNPGMAAATLTAAQAEAMKTAAGNRAVGPMMAFANMNMAAQAGNVNADALYRMAGEKSTGSWTCSACGTLNRGKFCTECGARRPAGALVYRCDKCGWEPKDPAHPPKFCPECGDIFDDRDECKSERGI